MTINGVSIVSLRKKTICKYLAKLSELEQRIYQATHNMGKMNLGSMLKSGKAPTGQVVHISDNFLRLRQACCDPGLLLDASKARVEKQIIKNEADEDDKNPQENADAQYTISRELEQLCRSVEKDHVLPAKARVLLSLLDRIYGQDPEAKVLIFAEWTKHLQRLLSQRSSSGYNFSPFHGELSPNQRDEAQAEYFPDGVNGSILTVGAGRVGSNLVKANIMIMLSPPWNPQRDAQAMDRAYRIGQHLDVEVHRTFTLSMELRTGYN
ncbi:hypothetical protein HO173_006931 [Letharia columbiana]|uniref:Helicase C-terminal domain-containing protein n=1 Tax=Letharia columbiana TaxID=112416 RepID=A0A8H6FUJ9_9LECA|nr:uncharacterized protein HO173_006931 [Letharia columbiana]KAF6235001.1 hypothetical protein HO173_006931 [Letharia columbiana]